MVSNLLICQRVSQDEFQEEEPVTHTLGTDSSDNGNAVSPVSNIMAQEKGVHVTPTMMTPERGTANVVQSPMNKTAVDVEATPEASSQETETTAAMTTEPFDLNAYEQQVKHSMVPYVNETTFAFGFNFFGGFCNQLWKFVGGMIVAERHEMNFTQILEESIGWKDLFGTNDIVQHSLLFDVVHWNSYYPKLPRLVSYDAEIFPDVLEVLPKRQARMSGTNLSWKKDKAQATKPFVVGQKEMHLQYVYTGYQRQLHKGLIKQRLQLEVEISKGALRPHPLIQQMVDKFIQSLPVVLMDNKQNAQISSSSTAQLPSSSSSPQRSFMFLHARIEPDMQNHPVCRDKKVLDLRDIIKMLYKQFPEPPVDIVLVAMSREILELEVADPNKNNTIAEANLQALNDMVQKGLWGGKVKVLEAGGNMAMESKHEFYKRHKMLVGSITNFFISLHATIFVGTEVSSFSTFALNMRFFRGMEGNFFYLPEGLQSMDNKLPHFFNC
eukprot:CAMPEP_0197239928 /NCGR_PEP_ID=MMETSP1429-20130617/6327_1 /TAXON_ID=49237 /ORGANISM="Chaetoceros  sp., Strain UNC1202" /LENGTH=495 /DNA_ID=CAMNT_0042699473 /DNA_START=141 /DNA_END=1628 /DNA_ORIENTATION=-